MGLNLWTGISWSGQISVWVRVRPLLWSEMEVQLFLLKDATLTLFSFYCCWSGQVNVILTSSWNVQWESGIREGGGRPDAVSFSFCLHSVAAPFSVHLENTWAPRYVTHLSPPASQPVSNLWDLSACQMSLSRLDGPSAGLGGRTDLITLTDSPTRAFGRCQCWVSMMSL